MLPGVPIPATPVPDLLRMGVSGLDLTEFSNNDTFSLNATYSLSA